MADTRISRILAWFVRHGRTLPWRNTRDPYRIFVSEIMLQQTQVARVIDTYQTWLKRFPTWEALAHGRTDEVIRAWAGLGYNRRAIYLKEAATQVVSSGVPRTIEDWESLKGVGRYTARAVYAITERKPVLAIDTNVRRVAGRLFLGIPYPKLTDDAGIERALRRAGFGKPSHWALPQALMDIGSAVCMPKPLCGTCPFRSACPAANRLLSGRAKKPKRKLNERIRDGKRYPDRIYRGRILALVREHGVADIRTLGAKIDERFIQDEDAHWLKNMVLRLVHDGLLEQRGVRISLPKT